MIVALWLASAALAADVRGMTISCPTWGWEWGSDEMAQTLTVLDDLGVNWVSIHPYARIRANGRVDAEPIDPENPPEWLTRPIREAHARGQKVLIKPHLAYWGSPFSWRGAIHFDDAEDRARFFSSYQAWVRNLAEATKEADAFVVGTELDGTVSHEQSWRAVIAQVRQVYGGHLTYAANWDHFEKVPFWDAVDAVGVQAYFPLVKGDAPPTAAQLDAGWDEWLVRIRAVHQRTGKPVVFTELGYDRSASAAREPWASGGWLGGGEEVQEACMEAALRAVDREPAVVGAFLWKWFPGEKAAGDFRMSDPRMTRLIRQAWGSESRFGAQLSPTEP